MHKRTAISREGEARIVRQLAKVFFSLRNGVSAEEGDRCFAAYERAMARLKAGRARREAWERSGLREAGVTDQDPGWSDDAAMAGRWQSSDVARSIAMARFVLSMLRANDWPWADGKLPPIPGNNRSLPGKEMDAAPDGYLRASSANLLSTFLAGDDSRGDRDRAEMEAALREAHRAMEAFGWGALQPDDVETRAERHWTHLASSAFRRVDAIVRK